MNSRRNFLRMAGVGISGSLLQPLTAKGRVLNTRGRKVKIGMLMPQSTGHPYLPASFMNGFRSGVDQKGAIRKEKIELITESIHFGTPVIVKEKIQKLITENNVDLVAGILNPEVADHVGTLLRNAHLPAVIATAGESYPVREIRENPYLFINSLNLFQAAFHTGRYAVENFGRRVAMVTSFYESGYDALFSFQQGVEKAGGDPAETILLKEGMMSADDAADQLLAEKPDAIYIFLSGQEADHFIRTLYYRGNEIPLLTTEFITEEEQLVHLGEAARGLISITSWNRSLETRENRQFVDAYMKQWHRSPDLFSLLGYETGQLIYDALAGCGGDYTGEGVAGALRECRTESPRGAVSFDETGMINNRLYITKVVDTLLGSPKNEIVESFDPVHPSDELFAMLDNPYRSGWFNPYLFV